MKSLHNFIALLCISYLLYALNAETAFSSSTTGSADVTAVISRQLSIKQHRNLSFGRISQVTKNGTITVQPIADATRNISDDGILMDNTVPHNSARYSVSGQANSSYNITIPNNTHFLSDGAQTRVNTIENNSSLNKNIKNMLINQIIMNNVNRLEVTKINVFSNSFRQITRVAQLNNSGRDILFLGGTLQVKEGAETGTYSGNVTVTVSY